MNATWVQGFMEGAGCFSIVMRKSNTQVGYQAIADFSVKLPRSQKALLEEIGQFLGVGKVYETGKQVMLKSTSLEDAQTLVAFFQKKAFHSPSKQEEFVVWKKCVALMSSGKHLTRDGILRIAHLRDSVHHKQLWNKKSFCSLRKEMDPCAVYQETHALPTGCRACWDKGTSAHALVSVNGGSHAAAD